MLAMLPKIVTDPEPRALRYAVIATIPMVVVTAIAMITVNVSQSEGRSWLFAVVAFLVSAVGFVLWIGPYTLAAA
jgi:cellobiose-specific phosphotransferase system component IIC